MNPGTQGALRAVSRWVLIVTAVFNALSAIGGGIGMLATDGLGMPGTFLSGGPFTTFLWPGLILLVVVGGTQVVAAILLWVRRESGLLWSAVAGFGILIWIFVETGMIRGWSWLQVLYFTTGTVLLVLVLALLGVVAWLPRAPLRSRGPSTPDAVDGDTRTSQMTR